VRLRILWCTTQMESMFRTAVNHKKMQLEIIVCICGGVREQGASFVVVESLDTVYILSTLLFLST